MAQLLQALAVDVQAAVLADYAPAPWSAFNDVEDQLLRSLPPSQDYQTPSDTALLSSTFPQLLLNFTEAEAVKLMLLGLRDADAIACITHGFNRSSAAASSQLNPVDAVFRMAADMSGCFTSSRALVSASGSPSRINTNQVSPVDTVSRSMRLHMTAAFCARLCLAHVLFEQEDERQAASTGAHKARCCSIM